MASQKKLKQDLLKIIKDSLTKFLLSKCEDELLDILDSDDLQEFYKIVIDFPEMTRSTRLVSSISNAEFFFDILPISVKDAQKQTFNKYSQSKPNLSLKENISIRIEPSSYPVTAFPDVDHANKLITFNGTVTKVLGSRVIETTQVYVCNQCGFDVVVKLDYSIADMFEKPMKCSKVGCPSSRFTLKESTENKKNLMDYQEIKIQEKLDLFSAGSLPRSVVAILEADLVDKCKPGDDVTIVGIVVIKYERFIEGRRIEESDVVLYVNNLVVNNDDLNQIQVTADKIRMFELFWEQYKTRPLTGRNIILSSLCPKLYGMYIVKLAVCLVIVGGTSRTDACGTRVRGESHLLLAGDPGTGKSQFLKYAHKLMPRSVLTNGIGNSSAGLTATASREGGLWHLDAGALVLADGGICCVDEFNCMREQEKMSMLEAMEQQSISVAKAGIVTKLKTQCSVLAACNPKGRYDHSQPATINLAMSSPLLSRFDLVFLLLDTPNEQWDYLATTFLLEGVDKLRESYNFKELVWEFEQLQMYLNHVRGIEPEITPDANEVIVKYYQLQRNANERNAARTTVRMLESVIRLSQAHAKLMFRHQVLVMDAIVAITLMECSLNMTTSFFGSVNILHTSFPEDAETEYSKQFELILTKLNLEDSLKKEMHYLKTHFEPFLNETKSESKQTHMTNHNFDIISQMVSNTSTQQPQPTSISSGALKSSSTSATSSIRQSTKRPFDNHNDEFEQLRSKPNIDFSQQQQHNQQPSQRIVSTTGTTTQAQNHQTQQQQKQLPCLSESNMDFDIEDLKNDDCDL